MKHAILLTAGDELKPLSDNKFNYPEVAIEEALTRTNATKREHHGTICCLFHDVWAEPSMLNCKK